MSAGWRYFAQRMDGTGPTSEIFDVDLPLANVEIEEVLTGHNTLSATVTPEVMRLKGSDGEPILTEWGTAIWAERDGILRGGIVDSLGIDGPDLKIQCTDLTGYAMDMPYTGGTFFVETDALDIFRHIWDHIQGQAGGNVGLTIDDALSGVLIGTTLRQVEFDTVDGPVSFEAGPFKLAWHKDHDLASVIDKLAADTPFDWVLEHSWNGDDPYHYLRIGYPSLGRRRKDLRFVYGENIMTPPSIERDGDQYASEVWVLGAGEGSGMKRGTSRRDIGRLRRVGIVSDPSLRSVTACTKRADREMAWRAHLDDISTVTVHDHPNAPLGSPDLGDEILLEGPLGWVDMSAWVRVISRKMKPDDESSMELGVVRSDRIAWSSASDPVVVDGGLPSA